MVAHTAVREEIRVLVEGSRFVSISKSLKGKFEILLLIL